MTERMRDEGGRMSPNVRTITSIEEDHINVYSGFHLGYPSSFILPKSHLGNRESSPDIKINQQLPIKSLVVPGKTRNYRDYRSG